MFPFPNLETWRDEVSTNEHLRGLVKDETLRKEIP